MSSASSGEAVPRRRSSHGLGVAGGEAEAASEEDAGGEVVVVVVVVVVALWEQAGVVAEEREAGMGVKDEESHSGEIPKAWRADPFADV